MDKKVVNAARHQTNEKLGAVLRVIRCIENADPGKVNNLSAIREICSSQSEEQENSAFKER